MSALDLQALAQAVVGRLLNTAAVGMILAGVVWVFIRLIGRQNSRARFAIWFAALLAVVALPFFAGSGLVASRLPALPPGNLQAIVLSGSWAFCLFAGWAATANLLLLRLGVGMWRVHSLRKNCADVDPDALDPAVAKIWLEFAARRRVTLCTSKEISVPAAFGFLRPAIVFPARLIPELSAEEFKIILLHELAHLRRWDDWTNLAQKILQAVFFFHPAVWWIESHLTLEREMACDDMVLEQTASPRAYAASLISFAEKLESARALALAQAIVGRMRQMSLRIAQILDAKRPSRSGTWKPVLGVSTGLLALVLFAAPNTPRFIAFRNSAPLPEAATAEPQRPGVAPSQSTGVPLRSVGASGPKIIPAAFHPLTAPAKLTASPSRRPAMVRASSQQRQIPARATFVILQTTQYDSSGSAVWTLCIWRIGAGNAAERQLETAIVMSSI